MNSKDFLEEVKNSSICPKNFEEIYSEFQGFQKAALETLNEVHRVCEQESIPYQIAYGSLLGAIRDGGQIPWDYDVDIIVPFEQKERLISAFQKELDQKFYFRCPDTDQGCRHMIMRVAPVEYMTEAIHVDVFFCVGTPEEKEEREQYAKRIEQLSMARFGKLVNLREESLGNPKRFLGLLLKRKLPVIHMSIEKINREYNYLCSLFSSEKSTYCIAADISATLLSFPTSLLWETKLIKCDYGVVRIPVHYEKLLEIMYGDYNSFPALDGRISEVVSSYRRIKAFVKLARRKSIN